MEDFPRNSIMGRDFFFFSFFVSEDRFESISLDIDEYRSMEWNDRSGAFHMEIGVFLEF